MAIFFNKLVVYGQQWSRVRRAIFGGGDEVRQGRDEAGYFGDEMGYYYFAFFWLLAMNDSIIQLIS